MAVFILPQHRISVISQARRTDSIFVSLVSIECRHQVKKEFNLNYLFIIIVYIFILNSFNTATACNANVFNIHLSEQKNRAYHHLYR